MERLREAIGNSRSMLTDGTDLQVLRRTGVRLRGTLQPRFRPLPRSRLRAPWSVDEAREGHDLRCRLRLQTVEEDEAFVDRAEKPYRSPCVAVQNARDQAETARFRLVQRDARAGSFDGVLVPHVPNGRKQVGQEVFGLRRPSAVDGTAGAVAEFEYVWDRARRQEAQSSLGRDRRDTAVRMD